MIFPQHNSLKKGEPCLPKQMKCICIAQVCAMQDDLNKIQGAMILSELTAEMKSETRILRFKTLQKFSL